MSFAGENDDYRDLFLDGNDEELEQFRSMRINKFLDGNGDRFAMTAIYWFWMHKVLTLSEERKYIFSNVEKVIEDFLSSSSTENKSNDKDHHHDYYYWDLLTSSWSHLPSSHFIDIPNWILEIQQHSSAQTSEQPSWKRARTNNNNNNNKTLDHVQLSSNGRLAFIYLLAMIHHKITKLNLIDTSKSCHSLFVNHFKPLIDPAETYAGIALYWLDFMKQNPDSDEYSIDLIVRLLRKDET